MDPGLLNENVRSCLYRLSPGPVLIRLLDPQLKTTTESALQEIARNIERNELYANFLKGKEALLKSRPILLAKRSPSEDLPRRNSLAANRITETTGYGKEMPEREILKHALQAEEFCLEELLANSEVAFIAGLHFDWLRAQLDPSLHGYLEQVWQEGFLTARVAYALGALPREFRYQRYIFAGALLLKLGKVLMALNFPDGGSGPTWNAFENENSAFQNLQASNSFFVEKKRFPFTHNQMSALYIGFFGLLRPVEKAAFYYPDPSPLRAADRDLYLLTVLLSVAERMSSSFETLKQPMPEFEITRFQKNWLEAVGIQEAQLKSAAARIR